MSVKDGKICVHGKICDIKDKEKLYLCTIDTIQDICYNYCTACCNLDNFKQTDCLGCNYNSILEEIRKVKQCEESQRK